MLLHIGPYIFYLGIAFFYSLSQFDGVDKYATISLVITCGSLLLYIFAVIKARDAEDDKDLVIMGAYCLGVSCLFIGPLLGKNIENCQVVCPENECYLLRGNYNITTTLKSGYYICYYRWVDSYHFLQASISLFFTLALLSMTTFITWVFYSV